MINLQRAGDQFAHDLVGAASRLVRSRRKIHRHTRLAGARRAVRRSDCAGADRSGDRAPIERALSGRLAAYATAVGLRDHGRGGAVRGGLLSRTYVIPQYDSWAQEG